MSDKESQIEEKDSKFVDAYVSTLIWKDGVSDYNRTLILLNLRAFYRYLRDNKMLKK